MTVSPIRRIFLDRDGGCDWKFAGTCRLFACEEYFDAFFPHIKDDEECEVSIFTEFVPNAVSVKFVSNPDFAYSALRWRILVGFEEYTGYVYHYLINEIESLIRETDQDYFWVIVK